MLTIEIPGRETLKIENLVLDYNGTVATDGILIHGVKEKLTELSRLVSVYIITADTFGTVKSQLPEFETAIIPKENQRQKKLDFINDINAEKTVSIGNGTNDSLMLKHSALGISVLQDEGLAVEALINSDISVPGILQALELLTNPLRLRATLRS